MNNYTGQSSLKRILSSFRMNLSKDLEELLSIVVLILFWFVIALEEFGYCLEIASRILLEKDESLNKDLIEFKFKGEILPLKDCINEELFYSRMVEENPLIFIDYPLI